jgi:cysteinyl-tRNA synthetase
LCKSYGKVIKKIGKVLGILQQNPKKFLQENKKDLLQELNLNEKQIEEHIAARNKAREQKNWDLSDKIRDDLLSKGILIQDSKEKTSWTFSLTD